MFNPFTSHYACRLQDKYFVIGDIETVAHISGVFIGWSGWIWFDPPGFD